MGKLSEKIYCAFCKIPRRVYTKKHISLTNVLLSFLGATIVMLVVWHEFNAKMFILFAVYLAGVEIFVQIRWRMSVNCPYCGFDPVLYHKDRPALVKKVKIKLEQAKSKPGLLLSRHNPLENLPTRTSNELRPLDSKELPS